MDEQVREYIGRHNAKVQELALRLHELVLSTVPGINERFHTGYQMIMYGEGERLSDQPMYIALMKDSVNLGFIRGTQLPDPQHKLRGTGKTGRHVKISKPEDVDDAALPELIRAATTDSK
ncbi:MAG: hypothetical protein DLM69_09425 [Candidatus Chloroheliales bacterium]|nr:MAG: hypothetical protein DLM69_09425 [Chloroflexota bacterium]